MINSKKEVFRTWVSEGRGGLKFETLRERSFESLGKGEEEKAKILTSLLGNRILTIRDTFKEERQAIFQKLIRKEYDEYCQIYTDLFDRTKAVIEALAKEGLEIPFEIRVAAEVTLSNRLLSEVKALRSGYKKTIERGEIDRITEEAREHGFHLQIQEALSVLNEMLKERMALLGKLRGSNLTFQEEQIEEVIALLDKAEAWGLELSKGEAQDLMDEMLKEHVGGLEKSWWGDGSERPFPSNLILLAEKLDFNVEKFSEIVGIPGRRGDTGTER